MHVVGNIRHLKNTFLFIFYLIHKMQDQESVEKKKQNKCDLKQILTTYQI